MAGRAVIFSPEAETDLADLYDFIAQASGASRALSYIDRIIGACANMIDFPERGRRRDDIFPGLRIVGFERRISIAFHVTSDQVVIDRIFYGGRHIAIVSRGDDV